MPQDETELDWRSWLETERGRRTSLQHPWPDGPLGWLPDLTWNLSICRTLKPIEMYCRKYKFVNSFSKYILSPNTSLKNKFKSIDIYRCIWNFVVVPYRWSIKHDALQCTLEWRKFQNVIPVLVQSRVLVQFKCHPAGDKLLAWRVFSVCDENFTHWVNRGAQFVAVLTEFPAAWTSGVISDAVPAGDGNCGVEVDSVLRRSVLFVNLNHCERILRKRIGQWTVNTEGRPL